ncbi:MAG: response regulator [Pirellulaceae bacterium]
MHAQRIKILFADDSRVVRRILERVFQDYDSLEVVGIAENGVEGLEKYKLAKPDIVILDVEMPEMDGVETCAAIRKLSPTIPIIMFSSLTSKGTEATMDAMQAAQQTMQPSQTMLVALSRPLSTSKLNLSPRFWNWGVNKSSDGLSCWDVHLVVRR